MQILLVQDDLEIREKLSFSIEATFSWASVTRVDSLQDAGTALGRAEMEWNLLIIDLPRATKKDLEDFLILHQNVGTLLVEAAGSSRETNQQWNLYGMIERDNLISDTMIQIRRLIDQNKLPAEIEKKAEYTRIRTHILLSVAPLKGDIFIRLGEGHYVKLFHEGDSFEKNDLEKYTTKKGIDYLFVRTDQTQEFVEKYQEELHRMLKQSSRMSLEEVAKVSESIYDTIQSLGASLGFTKDVQLMARTQMKMTVTAMGKSPRLSQVLDKLQAFGGKYISSHSTLTGFLACAIASHLEWGSETTFQKLTLASMLHDITLENNALAECETMDEVENGSFTSEEKKDYKSHMVKAAEVARQFTEVPPDVDAIIAQHHEKPDGSGFPRGLTSAYISPLGAVFIVAHDLAKRAWQAGSDSFDARAYLEEAKEKYTSNQFRKVLGAIEKLYPNG